MNDDIADLSVQLVFALGAWERGEPGAKERHQAVLGRLERMAWSTAPRGTRPRRTYLCLVPNCGSLLKAHTPPRPSAA